MTDPTFQHLLDQLKAAPLESQPLVIVRYFSERYGHVITTTLDTVDAGDVVRLESIEVQQ